MSNTTRPTTDAGWLAFGKNLSTLLTAAKSTDYGTSTLEASDFQLVFDTYAALYARATEPLTRTKIVVKQKTDARRVMAAAVGRLDQRIRGFDGIDDAKLMELGFRPRKPPTRRDAPKDVPQFEVREVANNLVSFVAHGTGKERALASDASGVTVFTFAGEAPPATAEGWAWYANFSRASGTVAFDGAVTGQVWLCAVFYNDRGQGLACAPVGVKLAGANEVPNNATQAMKIAA